MSVTNCSDLEVHIYDILIWGRVRLPEYRLFNFTRWTDTNEFMAQIVRAGVAGNVFSSSGTVDCLTQPAEWYTEENTNRVKDYMNCRKKEDPKYFSSPYFLNEALPTAQFAMRYFAGKVAEIQNILWDYELYPDSKGVFDTRRITPEHCAFLIEAIEQFAQRIPAGPMGVDPRNLRAPGNEIAKASNFFEGHPSFPKALKLKAAEGNTLLQHQDFLRNKLRRLKDTRTANRKAKAMVDFYRESSNKHEYKFAVDAESQWENYDFPANLDHLNVYDSEYDTTYGYRFTSS